jgi:pantothenate kinase
MASRPHFMPMSADISPDRLDRVLSRDITLSALAALLAEKADGKAAGERLLVGLVGPPGAGKSTCANELTDLLNATGRCRAAVFQMDGFHYDDGVLAARGLRSRKGSPETFDVAGFRHMLDRLRKNVELEVAVPVFDRSLEISRAGARVIPREIDVLVVEGNYLLLDQAPWSDLEPLFDVTVRISVPEKVLRQRLHKRWESLGIPAAEVAAKVDANDHPNGVLVLTKSLESEFLLRN